MHNLRPVTCARMTRYYRLRTWPLSLVILLCHPRFAPCDQPQVEDVSIALQSAARELELGPAIAICPCGIWLVILYRFQRVVKVPVLPQRFVMRDSIEFGYEQRKILPDT